VWLRWVRVISWFAFEILCAAFVFSVSLWWMFAKEIHHRDTENTECAQRKT